MGPWIVPAECVGDPQRLKLSLAVNDTMMQAATTAEMIWTLAEQIAYLSSMLTLRPGDVLLVDAERPAIADLEPAAPAADVI